MKRAPCVFVVAALLTLSGALAAAAQTVARASQSPPKEPPFACSFKQKSIGDEKCTHPVLSLPPAELVFLGKRMRLPPKIVPLTVNAHTEDDQNESCARTACATVLTVRTVP